MEKLERDPPTLLNQKTSEVSGVGVGRIVPGCYRRPAGLSCTPTIFRHRPTDPATALFFIVFAVAAFFRRFDIAGIVSSPIFSETECSLITLWESKMKEDRRLLHSEKPIVSSGKRTGFGQFR